MTDEIPGAAGRRAQTVVWMHAIAAGLQAGGLDARVYDIRGVLDIRATLYNAGSKGTDVTVDEDGYVQISYWNDPGATPAQVIAVISRALAAISGPVTPG
jgi:hypothetical protein